MIDLAMSLAAAALVAASLISIKRMDSGTHFLVYLSHAMLATAGFTALLLPFFDVPACWTHRWYIAAVAMSCGGSALFLVVNRRRSCYHV